MLPHGVSVYGIGIDMIALFAGTIVLVTIAARLYPTVAR